jgi:hypothetical protein
MEDYFNKIKDYLVEFEFDITHEDPAEGVFVVQKESDGITNLIIGIAPPIVIIEQYLFKLKNPNLEICMDLLKKNRDIVHGAFVLDEEGDKVIYRDTLQVETLDAPELEASINSLSLLLSEYSDQIIKFSKY